MKKWQKFEHFRDICWIVDANDLLKAKNVNIFIGVCTDTNVIYQSILGKKRPIYEHVYRKRHNVMT